jgi:RND family efflux transporter MFP subunit
MITRSTAMLGGLVAAASVATGGLAQNGPPPAAVTVDAVRQEPVQEHRRVTGELRAMRRSRVATHEAGIVVEFPVREGLRVKAGDVLAQLDRRRLEVELEAFKADELAVGSFIEERQANLSLRERELQLYQQSMERGAANRREVLDAESAESVARARVRQAERQRDVIRSRAELLEERLGDMTITAPFDGWVVSRHGELGEWLGGGEAVVELVSTGPIEAWLDVPQQFFGDLTGGQVSIEVRIEAADRSINVSGPRVIPQVDPRARSFTVVARLEDEQEQLTPGMSVTAWLPTGQLANRLTISRDAVLRNDAGAYVYVARGGTTDGPAIATPVNVQVLFSAGERVVVAALDLRNGDLVVVEGNERLFPGMPITGRPREGEAPRAATGGPR